MRKNKLISIAMTTYNGEKYVVEQLQSFVTQTRQPDELVIVDDGSTDGTIDILNEFKNTAPFEVKIYINQANLGYTQNFNKAMQLCTNDLIFLSDQDDVWFPTKLEYMFNLSEEYSEKVLFMIDAALTDGILQDSGLTKQGQIKGLGLNESSFVMGCCVAVKKSYLDLILPIPKGFSGHDDWIVSIADMLDMRYVDSSIQQYYRIHGNNTSSFTANRLVKNNKWNIKEKFVSWLKFSRILTFNNIIQKKNYFIAPLEVLSKKQINHTVTDRALIRLKKDIEFLEKRLEIVKTKNIFERTAKALKLYFHRDYDSINGFKSCLGDIIRNR